MTAAIDDNSPFAATTLVIDSATDACSVALFAGARLVAGDYRVLGRGHAEALVPMIAALPAKGRADRIAVALGPGSFTGVRVGLAAARALALAWSAQLVGYPTLALVAAMARDAEGDQSVGVAMTGGHGEWFIEGFAPSGRTSRPLASLRPADAALATVEQIVAGNQAETLVAARGSGRALPLWPDARAFMLLPPAALMAETHPLYGRAPDARLPSGAA
ncbi:tRNA (adenosine(37)-N6)-threonylcarbamoyltransferase complex dimerization subunit type 1 TsaB [Novosphingobium sp. AP12]|uniref:tRNA (adenosine(37)-N6)-threonylcarbamoyltransferase complex dimerization subunit type 1 TsaB n=1 Tax=Novosphingobium sp. AP12 TaxID=1144305 RepID=UPI0002721F7A|nr:tRNA (adenosine(37)-N6)-threonylcarbamoyltransferase complex dimerization subunit type 1 TsaB [Novosphingobium sp. AP12]EJL22223.1 universal bacterial protein YeaZ [Novosphingobium sp. AP12]